MTLGGEEPIEDRSARHARVTTPSTEPACLTAQPLCLVAQPLCLAAPEILAAGISVLFVLLLPLLLLGSLR
jgi:hypothetical protein